jgi:ADP-heptose:LPS heptosyltransferase
MSRAPGILVVRRDNIGDLVCTTPLLVALRRRFPDGWIAVLANSYNAPVLAEHPDLDAVYAYRKGKHAEAGLLALARERIGLVRQLRRLRLDYVVLATPAYQARTLRLAQLLGARHIVGFVDPKCVERAIDCPVPLAGVDGLHHVELVFRLAGAFGIDGPPPSMRLAVDASQARRVRSAMAALPPGGPLIGIHVSARKPSQRWPAERFVALMRALHERHGARYLLFWSPGPADHPQHPGDDDKAQSIVAALAGVPVLAWETHALPALVAGLAACDNLVCSDGGAMHVAAALGRPIVCFFGNSDATLWRPWGVPYRLLQRASREATDIAVEEALAAWEDLAAETAGAPADPG